MCLINIAKFAPQRGITLIEVLTALAVMSVGLLAVTVMMTRALHIRVDDIQQIRAERLLADAGEIAALLPAPDPLTESLTADWQTRATASLPQGEGNLTADTVDALAGLRAELNWVSRTGAQHSLRRFYPLGPGSLDSDSVETDQ